jgi:hypothetical protein
MSEKSHSNPRSRAFTLYLRSSIVTGRRLRPFRDEHGDIYYIVFGFQYPIEGRENRIAVIAKSDVVTVTRGFDIRELVLENDRKADGRPFTN